MGAGANTASTSSGVAGVVGPGVTSADAVTTGAEAASRHRRARQPEYRHSRQGDGEHDQDRLQQGETRARAKSQPAAVTLQPGCNKNVAGRGMAQFASLV